MQRNMYNVFIICLCNLAIAAVIPEEKDATILNYDYQNNGRGNYQFSYATSNGIQRNETGQLVNTGGDNEHISVRGFYSYVEPDGKRRLFQYTADEHGYQVKLVAEPMVSVVEAENEESEGLLRVSAPGVSPVVASLLGR